MQHRLIYLLILTTLTLSCSNTGNSNEKVTIFHAGSLAKPLREIKAGFSKKFPDIDVYTESAGSVACARKITDLEKKCDIIISADYKVIDEMLVPHFTDSAVRFARNEMVISYNKKSKYSKEINSKNWFKILLKNDVNFGRSDANQDPCGYRTILLWQLADKYYSQDSIEYIFSKKDKKYIRPKASDLIALLETGAIDYCFQYKSVAIQQKLEFITLPDEINLSKPSFKDYYKSSEIKLRASNKKQITIQGEPMLYGISILNDSKKDLATKHFFNYIFSDEGREIFKNNGQELIISKSVKQ